MLTFGFTNAVPAFQPITNNFVERHNLKYVNAYLDNIAIGGMNQESHDANLRTLKKSAEADHLKINESKS